MVQWESTPVAPDACPSHRRSEFISPVKRRAFRQNRGAAIMLSLWALFVLSAMVISWALDINTKLTNSGYGNRSLEAVAMACSGVDVAFHPSVQPGWPVLKGRFGASQGYETRITGEAGRLNLNWIVAGILTGQETRRELLRKFLEIKGIDLNEREQMIDCLVDWIDPDNLVQLNGAEDEAGYKAANKPLGNLEELKRVRGWEEFTSRADWEADLTLYTPVEAAGAIDVRWASRDVLLALPGMTEGLADRFIAFRGGPDEIEGNEDDPVLATPQDVQIALGLLPEQFNQLSPLLANISPNLPQVIRILSVGKSGPVTRTVRVVVRKMGNGIQLVPGTWKEF
jgi:hypothetical protein